MDNELLNELMSKETANKLKEILKDVPEPKEEVKGEIRVNSMNLAFAVRFLTLAKYTTVSNKDPKTMNKYKNYFLFENTKSVRKALEILNILKTELRKEQLEKTMEEGKK